MKNAWQTRDFVLTAVIAVTFGLLYLAWGLLYGVLTPFLGPVGVNALYGFWFIAGTLSAYVLRKPGAALLGEFLGALVELLAGSPYGASVLISGFLQGLGSEVAFAATGWRSYRWPVMALSGGLAGAAALVRDTIALNYLELAPLALWGTAIAMVLSGVVLGGLFAKGIGDALAATGVLDNLPIGRERRRRQGLIG